MDFRKKKKKGRLLVYSVWVGFGDRARPAMWVDSDSSGQLFDCGVHFKNMYFGCLWVDAGEKSNNK